MRTSTREPRRSDEELRERRRVACPGGTRICGGIDGRRAVVLEAELLEHLVDVFTGGVLEVERVAVDHPAVA